MARFKGDDISERLATAKKAKDAALSHFRSRPAENDPAVIERKAAQIAVGLARDARIAQREAAKLADKERQALELKAREDEATRVALELAERTSLERQAEADREVTLLAEQKAARDARYAARKARRR